MILTKTALKTIKTQLDLLGYTNYLYIAPQSTAYPFITFFPISNDIEYTFGQNKEDVNVQMSLFSNDSDVVTLLDMAEAIETAFDELEATDGDNTLYCTHRVNESGPQYLDKEHYWTLTIDLKFNLIKPKA